MMNDNDQHGLEGLDSEVDGSASTGEGHRPSMSGRVGAGGRGVPGRFAPAAQGRQSAVGMRAVPSSTAPASPAAPPAPPAMRGGVAAGMRGAAGGMARGGAPAASGMRGAVPPAPPAVSMPSQTNPAVSRSAAPAVGARGVRPSAAPVRGRVAVHGASETAAAESNHTVSTPSSMSNPAVVSTSSASRPAVHAASVNAASPVPPTPPMPEVTAPEVDEVSYAESLDSAMDAMAAEMAEAAAVEVSEPAPVAAAIAEEGVSDALDQEDEGYDQLLLMEAPKLAEEPTPVEDEVSDVEPVVDENVEVASSEAVEVEEEAAEEVSDEVVQNEIDVQEEAESESEQVVESGVQVEADSDAVVEETSEPAPVVAEDDISEIEPVVEESSEADVEAAADAEDVAKAEVEADVEEAAVEAVAEADAAVEVEPVVEEVAETAAEVEAVVEEVAEVDVEEAAAEAVVEAEAVEEVASVSDSQSASAVAPGIELIQMESVVMDVIDEHEYDIPAEKGPAFEIKPIPADLKNESYLRDNNSYRRESRSLLRTQDWSSLTEMMQNVLQYAPWADMQEVRSSILSELASIYGDRLNDKEKEKETYAQLFHEDPSNETALNYMEESYSAVGDYRAIHDMYRRVVDAVWEPSDRVFYTQKAADIAEISLKSPKFVISDWEHLWDIGEHGDDVQGPLMSAWRKNGCWEKLANFISQQCVDWGAMQRLGLREIVEIYISGMKDAERAQATLDVLLKDRPNDPLLLLQEVNLCNLNGDIDKLAELSRVSGINETATRDIQRAAAEVLWDKGEREIAVQAYDAILATMPEDRDALLAKEKYYKDSDNNELLCQFYEARANKMLAEGHVKEGCETLFKAAEVAEKALFDNEKAIAILKRIAEQDKDNVEAQKKLVEIYKELDDNDGVAESLEALLALTSRPAARQELLSELGSLYLDKLGNFEKAEACWKKVRAIDPQNPAVSEELSRVYAKQGDFEALDKSLTQQIRISDDANVLQLADTKARYLMQHSPDSPRSAAAWEIVLDEDPNHQEALENISAIDERIHHESEIIGAWEQALKGIDDRDEKIALALRIADACVSSSDHTQAISAYLRVLTWDPMNKSAIKALETICSPEERGIVLAVLEVSATLADSVETRCSTLRSLLRFIPEDALNHRIRVMRRILSLGDVSILSELEAVCREKGRCEELSAACTRIAYEEPEKDRSEQMLCNIARIHAQDLNDQSRAFTVLFASALDAVKAKALLNELEQLAPQTNRWEEVVAILGALSSRAFDDEDRLKAILRRIEILRDNIHAPARVLEEYRRLISMDPSNSDYLSQAEQIASENSLNEALIALYDEVWDASDDATLRSAISAKRYHVFKDVLGNASTAMSELLLGYRFAANEALENKLFEEAQNREHAALCVSMLEANKRASNELACDDLKRIASIYENVLESVDPAYAIYSAVLIDKPEDAVSLEKMSSLVEQNDDRGRYAQTLRLAASHAHKLGNPALSLELYRRLANYYRSNLNDIERSIDVERKILRLNPTCVESLEVLIKWHESREEWTDLRSEYRQRIAAGGTSEECAALWLKIADLSRNQLGDLEGAFDAYAEILQIDENNEAARQGINDLTGSNFGPDVVLRKLRLELKLASEDKQPEIMLQIADVLDKQLGQHDAACEQLEKLYARTGACGIGYEPLYAMYEKQGAWSQLVDLLLKRAEALTEEDELEAISSLNQALEVVDDKLKDKAKALEIIEKLRTLDPDNEEIFERYCASLRANEQWAKYADSIRITMSSKSLSHGQKVQLFELARVQHLALDQKDDAIKTYKQINSAGSNVERNAYFGIATVALEQDNKDLYLQSLDQVLKLFNPVWGAIFYCHMAEVADEMGNAAQVANYYRAARMLDPNNAVASESLRAIGRRLKNWRQTSALLPIEGEKEMSWADRSAKLVELSEKAADVDEARLWLWKAIAVHHDNMRAWQCLAKLEKKAGQLDARYEAAFGALGALERATLPSPTYALTNAQLMREVALAALDSGKDQKAESLYRKAYALAPSYAPVAVAVGDIEQESGNLEKAYAIYDAILKDSNANLDDAIRSELLFKRGLIANIQQKYELALDDLRATVKVSPLHYDALLAISKTYAQIHQPLLALFHLQKSLLVTPDHTKRRGSILYDMGKIWSDDFQDSKEAGIYYEGALDNGNQNVDLVERCLEIYKESGRYREALELVDTLTKTTTDSRTLASLWCTRGELSESISIDQASEAYDMALSYVPGLGRALDGLERTLVAREEWAQLCDLLEGRLEGDLEPAQEAAILTRLADLYAQKLNQTDKANKILYRVLDFCPTEDVITRLLSATDPSDEAHYIPLLQKAVRYCGHRFSNALTIAQSRLNAGNELTAWTLISPLRLILQVEPKLKETLNDLKTKFEKADSTTINRLADAMPALSDEQFAILDAIRFVREKCGAFNSTDINVVAPGASEVAESTPNGKVFQQLREKFGLENIALYRSADIADSIIVIDGDPVTVVIKTEIFQKATGNELQFWLTKALAMAHPDLCTLASMPEPKRNVIAKAILAVCDLVPVTPEIAAETDHLKSVLSVDDIKNLVSQLTLSPVAKLAACAESFADEMLISSDILAAFAIADFRTVWRAESRIHPEITEQRAVKTVDDIDAAIDASPVLSQILSYYVSDDFNQFTV